MAEILAVLQLDGCQHGQFRPHDIGSVEPPSHAGLKHRPVEPLLPEQHKGGKRYQFKPARLRLFFFIDMRRGSLPY